jgi:hypothetical protein
MLLSEENSKLKFDEILQLGKFDISGQELKNVSLFLTKVSISNNQDLIYKSKSNKTFITKLAFIEVSLSLNPTVFRCSPYYI